MGDKTGIEWTDATWNPVTGCDHVSPGCDFCYAEQMAKRLAGRAGYPADEPFRLTLQPDRLDQPLRWSRPRRIFVNSMSDLFHQDVPPEYIERVFSVMVEARQHVFQVLTKRPQRMRTLLVDRPATPEEVDAGYELGIVPGIWDVVSSGVPASNVWLGTSIESDRYCFRADYLRRTPAAVRFLSLEPLLGPLPSLDLTDIDWVIVGGESGARARPMHPQWARDLRDRCIDAGVPFLFKQWGAWATAEDSGVRNVKVSSRRFQYASRRFKPDGTDYDPRNPATYYAEGMTSLLKVGKHAAGRTLDGRTWDEYPDAKVPA